MSQYPSPYQPPNPYNDYMYAWGQYQGWLAPFHRASMLMFVLGGLGLACGLCLGISDLVIPWKNLPQEFQSAFAEIEAKYGAPASTLLAGMALVSGIPSLLMIVLGIFVRRGSTGAAYVSIVLVAIGTILLVLNLIAGLHDIGGPAGQRVLPAMCLLVVVTALFILLLAWLIRAIRAAPLLRAAQAQYQAQYWQYWQNQQHYAQGYGSPNVAQPFPPPQTQAPQPPPPPPDQPPPG